CVLRLTEARRRPAQASRRNADQSAWLEAEDRPTRGHRFHLRVVQRARARSAAIRTADAGRSLSAVISRLVRVTLSTRAIPGHVIQLQLLRQPTVTEET